MKIYLVKPSVEPTYEEFSEAVVAAENSEQAVWLVYGQLNTPSNFQEAGTWGSPPANSYLIATEVLIDRPRAILAHTLGA